MRATLYIAGAVIEFVGIVLLASPDLIPYAQRVSAWLTRQYERARARLRRLFRPRHVTVSVSAVGAIATAGHVTFKKSVANDATLEDKVRFLLTRDEEAQRDVQALARGVEELHETIDLKLGALGSKMTAHVAESLDARHREYLALRLVGVALVVVGLTLATLGNFA